MTNSQLYQPAARWPTMVALAVALTIELTALGIASLPQEEVGPIETGFVPPSPVEVDFTIVSPEATPPEEQTPPPLSPPELAPDFVVIEPAPPPQQSHRPRVPAANSPSVTRAFSAGPATLRTARVSLTSAPPPAYPYEARRSHQTGSGTFLLHFDASGEVIEVAVTRSTGSAVLDQISSSTFRRWRCRPGACEKISVPVTFTLAGSQL